MWFQNLKLGTKLTLSFGLIVFILLAVNIYSNLRLFVLKGNNNEIAEVHLPSLVILAELKLLMSDFHSAQLEHSSTKETIRMLISEKEMDKVLTEIAEKQNAYKLFIDKENKQNQAELGKLFEIYKKNWTEYLKKHEKFLQLSRINQNEEAILFLEKNGEESFNIAASGLTELLNANKKIFFNQVNSIEKIYSINVAFNLAILLIPLGFSILTIIYLVRIIRKPIQILEKAVNQVSQGNLDVEIKETSTDDEIGRLTQDFKIMTENIRDVKNNLDKREWVRNARTELNQIINESIDAALCIEDFSQEILTFIIHYTQARLGAIYLVNRDKTALDLVADFALTHPKKTIEMGEGLLGEFVREIIHKCNRKKYKPKPVFTQNLPADFLPIASATGQSHAQNLIHIPFQFENELIGMMEIAGWEEDTKLPEKLELAELIIFSLGIGFHSQLNAIKVRQLLLETQQQAIQLEEQATLLEEKNQDISQQKEEIEAQRDALETEQKKADTLLLNILPLQIAQELKESGHATPQYYQKASVMFTDFKGFTRFSSLLSPAELVAELDYCFLAFDEITEKYGLEKIKTIGDSYMCAGGLPTANDTNPIDTVLAALEICAFMQNWQAKRIAQGKESWHIRIGIHTGELVAGVVGKKKFAYDIWGDAVNIASRMESNSEADKINISAATYHCLEGLFDCTFRGNLPIKNGGEVAMYFVNGKV